MILQKLYTRNQFCFDLAMILVLLLLILLAISFLILLYLFLMMNKRPSNSPRAFLKKKNLEDEGKQVIVFLGDSLTHGRIGVNYVDILAERMDLEKFEVINAGVNGDYVWNLLQRSDEMIACKPEIVSILIGANDVRGSYHPGEGKRAKLMKGIPQEPDHEFFESNLRALVKRLKSETSTKILLCSLPTQEENPSHPAFQRTIEYSETVRKIAEEWNCVYAPINERMIQYQNSHPAKQNFSHEKILWEMMKALFKHYILRKNWDDIADQNGLTLHIDLLHLNTDGALLIANTLEEYLEKVYED